MQKSRFTKVGVWKQQQLSNSTLQRPQDTLQLGWPTN